jgi:hypothetical protein
VVRDLFFGDFRLWGEGIGNMGNMGNMGLDGGGRSINSKLIMHFIFCYFSNKVIINIR